MYVLIFFASLFSAIGNLVMKYSSKSSSREAFLLFLLGGLAYFCSLLIFKTALKNLPLSIGYPLLATTSMICSCIFANRFLNESLGLVNLIGIFLCCLGITFLSFNGKLI